MNLPRQALDCVTKVRLALVCVTSGYETCSLGAGDEAPRDTCIQCRPQTSYGVLGSVLKRVCQFAEKTGELSNSCLILDVVISKISTFPVHDYDIPLHQSQLSILIFDYVFLPVIQHLAGFVYGKLLTGFVYGKLLTGFVYGV